MSEQRDNGIDIYVLQPAEPGSDPNYVAMSMTWGNGETWTVINGAAGLVQHVENRCGENNYIRMLRISGHGCSDSFRLGALRVTLPELNANRQELGKIARFFRKGKSIVVLDHCLVGQNEVILRTLSEVLGGVPVVGPLDFQINNPGAPSLEGPARICTPYVSLITYVPENQNPQNFITYLTGYETITGMAAGY